MGKKLYSTEEILEMLKKADSKIILKFITNRIKEDEVFGQALGAYLAKPSTRRTNTKSFESNIVKALKKAFDGAQDEWGYSDYSDEDFIDTLDGIHERIINDSPMPELRIFLQIKLLSNFDIVTNYYDWEVFGQYLDDVIDDFKIILSTPDPHESDIRAYMCSSCLNYLGQFGALENELEDLDLLESFVYEQFEDEFPDQIKEYVEQKIQTIIATTKDKSWSRDYGLSGYFHKMLDLLTSDGASEKELLKYTKKYWDISGVRNWFIRHYKESGELDKAIEVLEESVAKAKDMPGTVSDYRHQLKELYLQTDQKEKYRDILLALFKDTDKADMEMYRQLKELYTPEQWSEVREQIYSSKKMTRESLAQFYAEDQLQERLLKLILGKEVSYDFFKEYAPTLGKEYSEKILARYQQFFEGMAYRATTKKHYKQILDSLKDDVLQIPGGQTLIDRLTSEWLQTYGNRKEFCQEIKKFRRKYKTTD